MKSALRADELQRMKKIRNELQALIDQPLGKSSSRLNRDLPRYLRKHGLSLHLNKPNILESFISQSLLRSDKGFL